MSRHTPPLDRSAQGSSPRTTPARATIEISKEYLSFSAAHFTVFSATLRENLHGHNFRVQAALSAPLDDNELSFDYTLFKRVVKALCDGLDERLLLPTRSPHLQIMRSDDEVTARFGEEMLRFLPRDVLLLPVSNISIEALSHYLLDRIRRSPRLAGHDLFALEVRVSSAPGQWGIAHWRHTGVDP